MTLLSWIGLLALLLSAAGDASAASEYSEEFLNFLPAIGRLRNQGHLTKRSLITLDSKLPDPMLLSESVGQLVNDKLHRRGKYYPCPEAH
jgi:hypothetical protein